MLYGLGKVVDTYRLSESATTKLNTNTLDTNSPLTADILIVCTPKEVN